MTHLTAAENAKQFLARAGEFRLGDLVTEQSHPVTRELSQTARVSVTDALSLLFEVDEDVVATYCEWIETDAPERIRNTVRHAVLNGGKVFFTGCGSTGRLSILLDAIWRDFWKRSAGPNPRHLSDAEREGATPPSVSGGGGEGGQPDPNSGTGVPPWADRTRSVMAGGDFALIKSVEGFEDFTEFGARQIEDMGVSEGDVVFAITEGGETSFVIGTAWQGLKKGAKVYFVYNNPDDVLRRAVTRSREVLDEPQIEKISLTTGPMAIMGSTRMQATTIQLCVMLTVLEMVIRDLLGRSDSAAVPEEFLAGLEELQATLDSERVRRDLAALVYLEETVYRLGRKSTYFADGLAIDVLTDTTERSPTFCIPAFREWDDMEASDSWTYLMLPYLNSEQAWRNMLKRPLNAVSWTEEEIRDLIGPERASAQAEIVKGIGPDEILRFRIGVDGLETRPIERGDAAVAVLSDAEMDSLTSPGGFFRTELEEASASGGSTAMVFLSRPDAIEEFQDFLLEWEVPCRPVLLPLPRTELLLDGVARVGVKMLLNALSTCTMVRLGRVLGNCMVAVVPSNLKLIDRSTRYIQTLAGLSYADACRTLFEATEYVGPRMDAGKDYPPVVALSVVRVRDKLSFEEAELRLREELGAGLSRE